MPSYNTLDGDRVDLDDETDIGAATQPINRRSRFVQMQWQWRRMAPEKKYGIGREFVSFLVTIYTLFFSDWNACLYLLHCSDHRSHMYVKFGAQTYSNTDKYVIINCDYICNSYDDNIADYCDESNYYK